MVHHHHRRRRHSVTATTTSHRNPHSTATKTHLLRLRRNAAPLIRKNAFQMYIQAANTAAVPPRRTSLEAESTTGGPRGLEREEMVRVQREPRVERQLRAERVHVEVARAARVEEAVDEVAAEVAEAVVDGLVD